MGRRMATCTHRRVQASERAGDASTAAGARACRARAWRRLPGWRRVRRTARAPSAPAAAAGAGQRRRTCCRSPWRRPLPRARLSQAALPIRIGPPDALPKNSFVRVRGLPPTVSLSEGYATAPGAWAVPLYALASLQMIVPAGVTGRAELSISLVAEDGDAAGAGAGRCWSSQPPPEPAATAAQGDQGRAAEAWPPRPPRAPILSPADREAAERLIARGEREIEQGNVAVARQFFLRAAQMGLARGAAAAGRHLRPARAGPLAACRACSPTSPRRANGTSAPASWARRRPRSGWRGWAGDALRGDACGASPFEGVTHGLVDATSSAPTGELPSMACQAVAHAAGHPHPMRPAA